MPPKDDNTAGQAKPEEADTTTTPAPAQKDKTGPSVPTRIFNSSIVPRVDVHPLVLLAVVDHFRRMNAKQAAARRVIGILLGTHLRKGNEVVVDISSCFAVPFDEDAKDPSVYFLDTNYAEEMFRMQRKVMPRIKVVGWYSTGPAIRVNDLDIHLQIVSRFCEDAVYCIVNTDPTVKDVPVLGYRVQEGREGTKTEFRNVPTQLGSVESEEVGIEHLLRDLTDTTITTLSTRVADRLLALNKLDSLLGELAAYLLDVAEDRLPICDDILNSLQELVNVLPLTRQLKGHPAMVVLANDQELATFVASITRCVAAIYDVILNRRKLKQQAVEKQEAAKAAKATKAAENEKDKKAKEDPTNNNNGAKAADNKDKSPSPK